MRVRMFIGEYEEYDSSAPVPQAYLACVSYPMEVQNPDHGLCGEPERITLHSRPALEGWAGRMFASYEIWEMEVPEGAVLGQTKGELRKDV